MHIICPTCVQVWGAYYLPNRCGEHMNLHPVPPTPRLCAQVGRASGPTVAGAHATFGAFLLFNVLFNHAQCVWTSPGTTLDADAQVCVRGGGED